MKLECSLGSMRRDEVPAAAMLAARALRDNPISLAMMPGNPTRRLRLLEAVFRMVLDAVKSPPLAARREGVLAGFASVSPPNACFFRLSQENKIGLTLAGRGIHLQAPPVSLGTFVHVALAGPRSLGRIQQIGEAGMMHDPIEPHCHVELVVVEPVLQRLGLGRKMMTAVCAQMDTLGERGYLETDTQANVAFYRSLGFEVTGEADPARAHVWYMERVPGAEPGSGGEPLTFLGAAGEW